MRINPIDIRQQQFTKRLRGYDSGEVEAFLEEVAEDFESVIKENALLKEQLSTLEERTRNLSDREKTLQDTLVTTHRIVEEMKTASRREADLALREAQLSGEKVMEQARAEEAKIHGEILALKRVRRQLADDLRATVSRYDRMLARETPGEDGGDADAQ
jgi:cell division initiation protein